MSDKATNICLAIGAGAIGKAISGYIFSSLGFETYLADVSKAVVDDINRRKGYNLNSTFIKNVSGLLIDDDKTAEIAMKCDYICTSIGTFGLTLLIPKLIEWIEKRITMSDKPLYILLFENDSECDQLIETGILNGLGYLPNWLTIVRTSIERMSKINIVDNDKFDVISENFIPVIASKEKLIKSSIFKYNKYFDFVDNVNAYYYRKLYTNNLGHAVIAYIGLQRGYETITIAMSDQFIYNILEGALKESCAMLIKKFAFLQNEIDIHIEELLMRYTNEDLNDSLYRLARDPIRKLGRNERIIGTICECYNFDIEPKNIITTFFYALKYQNNDDPSSKQLKDILDSDGLNGVLQKICLIDKKNKIYGGITKWRTEFLLTPQM